METRQDERGWTSEVLRGLTQLSEHEAGDSPTLQQRLQEIASQKPAQWKAALRKHEEARLLTHATEHDITALDAYQQEALIAVGISVGH